MLCLGPVTDVATYPPGTGFESGQEINPRPDFTQNAVTGCHCQVEQAGDGGKLFQAFIAVMPAEAPRAATTVPPEDASRGNSKYNCAYDAEHAQAERKNGFVHALAVCSIRYATP